MKILRERVFYKLKPRPIRAPNRIDPGKMVSPAHAKRSSNLSGKVRYSSFAPMGGQGAC
jgi:hypothetical protein